jgi:hypothetical protein
MIAFAFDDAIDVIDSDGNFVQSLPLTNNIDLMQFIDENRIAIYYVQNQSRVLEILDIAEQHSLNRIMLDFDVNTMVISPGLTYIAAGANGQNQLKVFEIDTFEQVFDIQDHTESTIWGIAFTSDRQIRFIHNYFRNIQGFAVANIDNNTTDFGPYDTLSYANIVRWITPSTIIYFNGEIVTRTTHQTGFDINDLATTSEGRIAGPIVNFTTSQSDDDVLVITNRNLFVSNFETNEIVRNYTAPDTIVTSAFIPNMDVAIIALDDGRILRWQFYPEFDDLTDWIKENRYYEVPSCWQLVSTGVMRSCDQIPDVLRPNTQPTLEPIPTNTSAPYPIPTATLVIGTPQQ